MAKKLAKVMQEIAEDQKAMMEKGEWHPTDVEHSSCSTTDSRMAGRNWMYNDATGKWETPPTKTAEK